MNAWFCYYCVCVLSCLIQSLSHVRLLETPWTATRLASLSFTISQSLLKLMSIKSMLPSNHLVLCCPLLLMPSIFPSIQGLFQWIGSSYQVEKSSALCTRWKGLGASLASVLPMNTQGWFSVELTSLISLRSKELSRVFSNITVQKHQFFSTQLSL